MGRVGVEWLYRLLGDPKRLYYRYCIEPWWLIGPALADVWSALGEGRSFDLPLTRQYALATTRSCLIT